MADTEVTARRIDGIVIGASAGGVEALSVILPALQIGFRASIFVVIHLSRERPSMLSQIFATMCALPVREAQDKEPVEAGTLYFAPRDYHLLIEPGPQLALSVDDPVHFCRPSIDILFESAAQVYERHLLGIILTGANEDGAAGLDAVRQGGGVTVVQRPDTAQATAMVISALRRVPADFVLTLEEIAAMLGSLSETTVLSVPKSV